MAEFLDSLAEQIQNRWCALSTEDIVLGGLIAAGSGVGFPALGIAGVVGVARKSSDQICGKSTATPDYALPESNFSGGQCEGVLYAVGFDYTVNGTSYSDPPSFILEGKITSINLTLVDSGTSADIIVSIDHAGGNVTGSLRGVPVGSTLDGWSVREVVRRDGLPDTCGDPPQPPPEPIEEYDDIIDDVPFDDENGDPVNFPNVPVKWFPPCISLEGIKIPFEITTPLGKICGQVQVKPDIKTGVKPKVDFDLCPSERQILEPAVPEKMKDYFDLSDEIGSIASPFPSSDFGGIPSLQADNEKPIMGVFIECGTDGTDKGKATKVFNNDNNSDAPTLFVPRLGYVRFWMLAEREEADAVQWSLPIEIKQPKAFIACPSPFGALAVDVQMNDGYQAKYKVAKRKTCCEACEKFDPNAPNDALDRCD